MPVLQASDIADVVAACQNELGRLKITDLSYDLQEYHALKRILKKGKTSAITAPEIQWNVRTTTAGAARHTGLHATDIVVFADGLTTAKIPWRHSYASYPIDEREITMNANENKIVDLVKERRGMAMTDLAKLLETDAWGTVSDDGESPFGFQYWLTYNAVTGFNGGNHTNFPAGPGGLSATDYPRWKNFTAQYTDVSKADLIRKMREAFMKCQFQSPTDAPEYAQRWKWAIYMNYETIAAFEDAADLQNDNLGPDVAGMAGRTTFRRIPLEYVPFYDDYSTSNPVIMVDWGSFEVKVLKGEFLRELNNIRMTDKHRELVTYIDLSWNMLCRDRRRSALIAKADWANGV